MLFGLALNNHYRAAVETNSSSGKTTKHPVVSCFTLAYWNLGQCPVFACLKGYLFKILYSEIFFTPCEHGGIIEDFVQRAKQGIII